MNVWKGWFVDFGGMSLVLCWGRVKVYACPQCKREYYVTNSLYSDSIHATSNLEEVLYLPKFYESNSKCHYVYPQIDHAVIIKKPTVLPKEVERVRPLVRIAAEFVSDVPFQHVAVLGGERFEFVNAESRECTRCYCSNIVNNATVKQGHLHLRKTNDPRVWSEHQPGVEKVEAVYNHRFIDREGNVITVFEKPVRDGVLGSVYINSIPAFIESPDHERVAITGDGWWEFYHPHPSDEVD